MSNEYDYSGLYNNTSGSGQPNGQNPQPEQSAPAQNQQPQQSSYPNVGSSGVNTANTARTDYSSCNSGSTSGQNPQQDSNGYTSSFSGGNGNNGGYNGYSYSSAPQQPPVPQKKKGSKVLLRVLACVGVGCAGLRQRSGRRCGRQPCGPDRQPGGCPAGRAQHGRHRRRQHRWHKHERAADRVCRLAQRCRHHHRADEQQPDLVRRLLRPERCRFRRHHQPGWLHPDPAPTSSAARPA